MYSYLTACEKLGLKGSDCYLEMKDGCRISEDSEIVDQSIVGGQLLILKQHTRRKPLDSADSDSEGGMDNTACE